MPWNDRYTLEAIEAHELLGEFKIAEKIRNEYMKHKKRKKGKHVNNNKNGMKRIKAGSSSRDLTRAVKELSLFERLRKKLLNLRKAISSFFSRTKMNQNINRS